MLPAFRQPTSLRSSGLPHRPLLLQRVSPEFAPGVSAELRRKIFEVFTGLPMMFGSPICFDVRPHLTAYRGKLLSGAESGAPVHAGAFIRKRAIVLETDLFAWADRLQLILLHELFHFVWVRLGNDQRCAFAGLLVAEITAGARGERGESSDVKKRLLQPWVSIDKQSRLWRDYACESFCDSTAAFFSGLPDHEHSTLPRRWVKRRDAWLLRAGEGGWKC